MIVWFKHKASLVKQMKHQINECSLLFSKITPKCLVGQSECLYQNWFWYKNSNISTEMYPDYPLFIVTYWALFIWEKKTFQFFVPIEATESLINSLSSGKKNYFLIQWADKLTITWNFILIQILLQFKPLLSKLFKISMLPTLREWYVMQQSSNIS